MSLLDTASLIVTPNGYKEGKLYSVIPSDGSGDMSVTRATTATRVNSAGLVELVPYNLLQYSEDLSNAAWNKTDVTITSNAITAPNGTLTADKVSSSVNGTLAVYVDQYVNGATPINVTHTYSVYAKAGEVTQMLFYLGYQNGIYFNLTTGQFVSYWSGAQDIIAYSSENVGNGWFRYNITLSSNDGTLLILFPAQSGSISFAQTIGNGFYIWGAQLNEGSLKDYQKTETRLNIPRLDYSNGTCPSLLVEPQRTNLALYSSSFDNAAWGLTGGVTITANNTISPSGVQDADRYIESTNANYAYEFVTDVSGTFTASLYVKKASSSTIGFGLVAGGFSGGMSVKFNLDTQIFSTPINYGNFSSITASYEALDNGWYRLILTGTTATATSYYFVIGSLQESYAANTYIWGAQLEVGNYSTSYIPTTSASVTRNADVISKTGISSLIGQTEGTLFVEANVQSGYDGNNVFITLSDGTSSNIMYLNRTNGKAEIYIELLGLTQVSYVMPTILSSGVHKLAVGYKANDFVFYIDGVLVHSDTSGNVPLMSKINIGSYFNNGITYNDGINAAALWKTRLTNTQLAQLTSI